MLVSGRRTYYYKALLDDDSCTVFFAGRMVAAAGKVADGIVERDVPRHSPNSSDEVSHFTGNRSYRVSKY
jgi:hypothetical protein